MEAMWGLGNNSATQSAGCISESSGVTVIDFRRCSSQQVFEVYQEFGCLCARSTVGFALLHVGDEDADAHYSLRDVLRTVVLVAEIPLQLRLAMVADSGELDQLGRILREELRALGCNAQVFHTELAADEWLRAVDRPARSAVISVVTAIAAALPAAPRIGP